MHLIPKTLPALAALACLTLGGCLNESDSGEGGPADYLVITTSEEGEGYAATFASMPSGEVDIAGSANAVQIQTGWGSGAQFLGRDFFIIASYTGVSGIKKFSVDANGKISNGGTLTGAEHFTVVSGEKGYYFDPALGKMKIQTFNPSTMERTGEIDCSSLSKGDEHEVVGDQLLAVHNGKLLANIVHGDTLFGTFTISKYDTGFVAVIDLATDKIDKVIKAPGVPFGFGYPADMEWAFQDEDGNTYLISPFDQPWTAPGERSGHIWRIKKGETDFDGWNYASRTYGDHRPVMGGEVLGGKIYSAFWSETIDAEWGNFVADNLQGVALDIGSKSVSVLGDSPKFRFNADRAVHKVDGKIYYSVLNESFNGVYVVEGDKMEEAFKAKTGGSVLFVHKLD